MRYLTDQERAWNPFFLGPQEIVDSWWELLTRAGTLVLIGGLSFILSKDLENYRVLRQ